MSAIQIRGLTPLCGKIEIQGSKNAVLPMMAASLLSRGVTVLRHVPAIADVFCMMGILDSLGCRCCFADGVLTLDTSVVDSVRIPEEFVGKMRSSVIVLGPLLKRMGEAVTYYPGGCVLGKRPIDLHLYALRCLGAEIDEAGGVILARAGKLKGQNIHFRIPSVGGTENALMAAVMAEGTTILENCAMEPEIEELCRFLTSMGARIQGAGSSVLRIDGVEQMFPCEFQLGGDRIAAGTCLAAAITAAGDVAVKGVRAEYLREPLRCFERMGGRVTVSGEGMEVRLKMEGRPSGISLKTGPYPQFPTDLQSPFLAVSCIADGESRIEETVFEARFESARQMRLFGADIFLKDRLAVVKGRYPLKPAIVRAPDLRGGAALVLAAFAADGASIISDSMHIERGYEDICRDFKSLGADIEKIDVSVR